MHAILVIFAILIFGQHHDLQMKFDGRWYCYIAYMLSASEKSQGASLISGDYCSQVCDSTTHVPKISETREYGFLYWFWPEKAVYVGATLQSGTTYQWWVLRRANA